MWKILALVLAMTFFSTGVMALSEKEYQHMMKTSPDFRKADKLLNETWKSVSHGLKKEDKKFLLNLQRQWLKDGRDADAEEYESMGYTRDCAYAKATRKWVSNLHVFNYNIHLSKADQDAGRAKADDAFWDEDDEEIPPHCRAY